MTLFDPHSIVVVTNALVMCFEIETTQLVPVACPDGIEGCCVAHFQEVKKKRYVPCLHGVRTNELGRTSSGIGFKLDLMRDIATAIREQAPSLASFDTMMQAAKKEIANAGEEICSIKIDMFYKGDYHDYFKATIKTRRIEEETEK